MRNASSADVSKLLDLMAEFYAEAAYPLNRERAAEAFASLIADDRLGSVWLIQSDQQDVGYLVLTLSYSMEYGGPCALLDDFFIRPPFRNAGLGTAVLAEARAFCTHRGVRAISVEVGYDNVVAQAAYRRAGFVQVDRRIFRLGLADATHIV